MVDLAFTGTRFRLALVLVVLVPLGIATKFYDGPAHAWVRAHAGGTLYVVFWCLLVLAIRPRFSPWRAACAVLVVTSILECLQLWHAPFLQAIRSSFLGHALIGSKFSWLDFPYYGLGALLAVGIARLASRGGHDGQRAA